MCEVFIDVFFTTLLLSVLTVYSFVVFFLFGTASYPNVFSRTTTQKGPEENPLPFFAADHFFNNTLSVASDNATLFSTPRTGKVKARGRNIASAKAIFIVPPLFAFVGYIFSPFRLDNYSVYEFFTTGFYVAVLTSILSYLFWVLQKDVVYEKIPHTLTVAGFLVFFGAASIALPFGVSVFTNEALNTELFLIAAAEFTLLTLVLFLVTALFKGALLGSGDVMVFLSLTPLSLFFGPFTGVNIFILSTVLQFFFVLSYIIVIKRSTFRKNKNFKTKPSSNIDNTGKEKSDGALWKSTFPMAPAITVATLFVVSFPSFTLFSF